MHGQDSCFVGASSVKGIGRGLFASCDLPAGSAVLSIDRPLIAAIDTTQLPYVCTNCYAWAVNSATNDRGDPLQVKACTGCGTLRYCSKRCQSESWKRSHKGVCKLLGQLSAKGTMPNAARAVLDMLLLFPPTSSSPPGGAASWWTHADNPFREMLSHRDEILKRGGQRAEHLLVLSTGVHTYSGERVSLEIVQSLFALVFTNSLTLYTSTFDSLGIVLDPLAAAANHSCEANAVVVFDGPKMQFRTLQALKKGDEVFIQYVDGTESPSRRRRLLQERFYFTCACSKCTREAGEENGDKNLQEVEDYGFAILEKVGKQDRQVLLPQLRRAKELCLSTKGWRAIRQPLPALQQEIFASSLLLEHWADAFKVGLKLYFDVQPELYRVAWHPTRVVQKWTLACLALQLASMHYEPDVRAMIRPQDTENTWTEQVDGEFWGVVVIGLLTEVTDNVRLSYGQDSTFAVTVRRKMDEVMVDVTRGDAGRLGRIKSKMGETWARLRQIANSST